MLHYESTNNALNRHVYFLNFRAILPRISIGLHSKNQLPNREATTMYFLHELNFTGTYGALPLIALSSPSPQNEMIFNVPSRELSRSSCSSYI